MRTRRILVFLLTLALSMVLAFSLSGTASDQEGDPRIIVKIDTDGKPITSIDILYHYANAIDLSGLQALIAANPGNLVPHTELLTKLPSPLDGWVAGDKNSRAASWQDEPYCSAAHYYHRQDPPETIHIIAWDTMGKKYGPWYAYWGGQYPWDQPGEGYAKIVTYEELPAWETWNYQNSQGSLRIGILSGIPVSETGQMTSLSVLVLALLWKMATQSEIRDRGDPS